VNDCRFVIRVSLCFGLDFEVHVGSFTEHAWKERLVEVSQWKLLDRGFATFIEDVSNDLCVKVSIGFVYDRTTNGNANTDFEVGCRRMKVVTEIVIAGNKGAIVW